MTVTRSSFPYNGFIFKIIHLFLTSGLISVSMLSPQMSIYTHAWQCCFSKQYLRSLQRSCLKSFCLRINIHFCLNLLLKKTKASPQLHPLPMSYLYRTPRTPESFILCKRKMQTSVLAALTPFLLRCRNHHTGERFTY